MNYKDRIFALNYAPPEPTDPIEHRRWWNQICINALTMGIASGCVGIIACGLCGRCDHRDHMKRNPDSSFIGFTKQGDL